MKRLAIFISHPIQYQAPLYRRLNQELGIDLTVYFYCKQGVKSQLDPGFGQEFKWDIPLLKGYKYKFLKNYSPFPGFHFFGFVNLGILKEIFQNKFDAVLVNHWSYLSDWLVFLSAWLTHIPILLRTENPLNQELLKAKWKRAIKKIILGRILFPRIKTFLYIGQENKKLYQHYGVPENKLFFTPYAVDNNRFLNEAENHKSQITNHKNEIGINPNSIAILFVGKLIAKKRPMDLLKAYEAITRNIRISPNIPNVPNKVKIVEKKLSYKLTGIFFEIHNELGRFARERQYAEALELKLKKESIEYQREFAIGVAGRKSNIADFIIEGKVLVELKRKPVNTKEDYQQIMRYLESAGLELGLLVNFGLEYLKPKRILNPKLYRNPKNPNTPEYTECKNVHSVNSDTFVDSGYSKHLVFVGDGALRPQLEKYVAENKVPNVYFTGFKNQTEISKYYALADILVLPSGAGETWGLVVNEAMCFGLPIIVSNLVGCGPDLVRYGENGYVYPVGDIKKLAKYLEELIQDESKRKAFGKKSFEIIQNYSYKEDTKGVLEALNRK